MNTKLPYDLVPVTDPILHSPVPEFDFANPPTDPVQLVKDLYEILNSHNALGLSANQVGLPYRVFVIKGNMCFFNPKIVDQSDAEVVLDEGCLSFPNTYVKIKRPSKIRIRATNENGQTATGPFDGITARVCLHEFDHLNGITFKDRANRFHWEQAMNYKKKLDRRQKNAAP